MSIVITISASSPDRISYIVNELKKDARQDDIIYTDRLKNLMTDDVKNKIAAEKAWYKQDAIDKMYGSPEKAEKPRVLFGFHRR